MTTWMTEEQFINWYCNSLAMRLAEGFHAHQDYFPVIYAGYILNGAGIFFVTQEDPEHRFECALVGVDVIEQCGKSNAAWDEYGNSLIQYFTADSFEEIAAQLPA